jgi:hypothetical protein
VLKENTTNLEFCFQQNHCTKMREKALLDKTNKTQAVFIASKSSWAEVSETICLKPITIQKWQNIRESINKGKRKYFISLIRNCFNRSMAII